MIPGGSEQPDVAELVARAGAAVVLPIAEATEHGVARAVEALLHGGELARRAQALARAFARLDGPDTAALLIERLGRTRAPVTRRDLARVEGGACP
jgi:UDP:flavonoid glycosyltransferase YjiC (YdhE family)